MTKTNLQISGPSHGREKPALMQRLYQASWRLTPFFWQEIDEGILPALYAAATPQAEGGAFYGPGLLRGSRRRRHRGQGARPGRNDADCRRLWEVSERLTGVRYPTPA
ncbi:hypothetical protein BZL30_5664 [Mycobacterium kansasii]|uniref:Uncharacterized protein n=1 Tax=Mycobacterium kansasii TaxID=1768 RepID=A0A1V3WZ67_MYCKA|nr:hypothetical protein BZL30_5664 [Mycobacterium kansasii]